MTPIVLGGVIVASASVNVSPSAPEPDPMNASNAALTPEPGTGVGQNAEPVTQFVAGVNCKFGGVAALTSCAEPFNCHPPSTGDGIVLGGGPAMYVNWSAVFVALVATLVVTVTSTVPAPDGAVAVMLVESVTLNGALFVPNCTALTLVKLVPVMITMDPPVLGPDVGLRPLIVGAFFGVQLANPAPRSAMITTTNAPRAERDRDRNRAVSRRTILILDRPHSTPALGATERNRAP
jgi:hypothetical protein